jgi:hypothetical protein
MAAPRIVAFVAGAVLAGVAALGAQQAPVFRAGSHTVPVYVTVTGADGQLVTDLAKRTSRSSTTDCRSRSPSSNPASSRSASSSCST